MSDKCVVLLSGGIDSTTLLYSLVEHYECYPITIVYGQLHKKEIWAARNVCAARSDALVKRWKYIDLSVLGGLLPSALTGVGDIPEGHYADESMKSTVVPNRNMVLLAIAGGYAQGIGAKYLSYGPHSGDHAIYPDCRPEFVSAITVALQLGTGWNNDGVELIAPFSKMTKTDIVRLGKKLNVPYRLTWSCYKGGDLHCGVCGTCVERKEAFKLAGVEDPTKYIE